MMIIYITILDYEKQKINKSTPNINTPNINTPTIYLDKIINRNKNEITYFPQSKKFDVKIILFDDFGEEDLSPIDLPYCKDCVRKEGDNWHSNENNVVNKNENLGNLISIVQYDDNGERVDIDSKFINIGNEYFKNMKISEEINGYLYPNKYAVKFTNIVRFPEEMGLIIYVNNEVVFYSRSSRSIYGGINQTNRKKIIDFMKNINDVDYFYVGLPSVKTNDYKNFETIKKLLNVKIN